METTYKKNLPSNSDVTYAPFYYSWFVNKFISYLQNINKGELTLILPDHKKLRFVGSKDRAHKAEMRINQWKTFYTIILRGEVGLGETFVNKGWDTPNLTNVISLLIKNESILKDAEKPSIAFRWLYKFKNWLTKNTPNQSMKNIHHHYDLGNNFYRLWLDKSMTYSCALFNGKDISLEEAQQAKYARILNRLNVNPGNSILEIGCGWGGFAEAASNKGCNVHGITLSNQQLMYALDKAKNFPTKTHFECRDYRDIQGEYDFVVSIGMFEHVGKQYWAEYFKKLHQLLKSKGKALIQTIIYKDNDYNEYENSFSFIRLYIFPGGFLPSSRCVEKTAENMGFEVKDVFEFGIDYAKTLSCWRDRFLKSYSDIFKLGFDERFKRFWLYYLCVCEAAFLTKKISVAQFELIKKN